MEPYNIKIYRYPDGSEQVRLYSTPVETYPRDPPMIERDPFYNRLVIDVNNLDRSLSESRKRSIQKIYDLARSNLWDWFCTFTFSPDRVDRYDYDAVAAVMSKWLNNCRKWSPGLRYLVVPEQHKDGAWHFHALMSGCDGLQIRDSGKYVVKKIITPGRTRFIRTKRKIYLIGRWHNGHMTATEIANNVAVQKYITKYITKDLCRELKCKKRYWASRNLEFPEVITEFVDIFEKQIIRDDIGSVASFSKTCDSGFQCLDIFYYRP